MVAHQSSLVSVWKRRVHAYWLAALERGAGRVRGRTGRLVFSGQHGRRAAGGRVLAQYGLWGPARMGRAGMIRRRAAGLPLLIFQFRGFL